MSSRSSATRARSTSTTTSSASSVATGHCPACRRATSSIDAGSRQPGCPVDRRGSDEPVCEGCLDRQQRGRGCDRCDRHWGRAVARVEDGPRERAGTVQPTRRRGAGRTCSTRPPASCCAAFPPRSRLCPTTGGASVPPPLPRHSPVITRGCLTSASASSPRRANGVIGGRVAFRHRHLRRGEVVDRQPPMTRCGVPAAYRQAPGGE
jgi:hypothetical protein